MNTTIPATEKQALRNFYCVAGGAKDKASEGHLEQPVVRWIFGL
jgi:hypothetical protein